MKQTIFMLVMLIIGGLQQSFAQNTQEQILSAYYNIKDALVNGESALAAAEAKAFVTAAHSLTAKGIHEPNQASLIKDAGLIATTQDLKKQREYFASLSEAMIHLAHDIKISNKPVYQMYCPMKKTSWLSAESNVRNPYFGSSMLTCGSVTDTIK